MEGMVERDSAGGNSRMGQATLARRCGGDHFTSNLFPGMRWPACQVAKCQFRRKRLMRSSPGCRLWSIDILLTEYCISRAVFASALARQFFKRSRKVVAIGKPYSNRHLFHAVAV